MLEWFRNKLHNFIFPQDIPSTPSRIRESTDADVEGLRFTVMPARGGTIVQLRTYDQKRDNSNTTTYVIPDGHDVAKEVGDIVSMELLKS